MSILQTQSIVWSREPDLGLVQSGTYIDYNFTAKIQTIGLPDPVTGVAPTILTPVTDLTYMPMSADTELPEYIEIYVSGTSVRVVGTIRADAAFDEIAYSQYGIEYPVDLIEDAPVGSTFCKLKPSPTEYVYYKWRVYSISQPVISRVYTLTVRTSWDQAKETINKYT